MLRPDVQMFDAMLEGWTRQQASRRLAASTIDATSTVVRRFQEHSATFPWEWTPAHLEEWTMDLRSVRGLALSTVRTYQQSVRLFLGYVCDPLYGWAAQCESRFGSHPVQICHAWNTAVHRAGNEARPQRRSLTRTELQALFDAADELVDRDPPTRPQGLGRGVQGRGDDQDRVHVRVASPRARPVGRPRLRTEPESDRVRRVRDVLRPLRQSQRWDTTEAAQRAHGDAVVGRSARAMGGRGVAALSHERSGGVVAVGEVGAGQREPVHRELLADP